MAIVQWIPLEAASAFIFKDQYLYADAKYSEQDKALYNKIREDVTRHAVCETMWYEVGEQLYIALLVVSTGC